MNYLKKSTIPSMAFALAFAMALSPLTVEANSDDAAWVAQCVDEWNDSAASDYCADATVTRVRAGTDHGKCDITVGCYVTATVNTDPSNEFTWAIGLTNYKATLADTDDLILCMTPNFYLSTGYQLNIRTSCGTTETSASTAVASGLAAPAENTGSSSN
ncbi:MAG: hypothetical protein OXE57_14925 [Alphaproteobacteria bacterium]|nr:hypothetical protein [Alphaproteobacteria bacterium]